jgi:hypothetical protein
MESHLHHTFPLYSGRKVSYVSFLLFFTSEFNYVLISIYDSFIFSPWIIWFVSVVKQLESVAFIYAVIHESKI